MGGRVDCGANGATQHVRPGVWHRRLLCHPGNIPRAPRFFMPWVEVVPRMAKAAAGRPAAGRKSHLRHCSPVEVQFSGCFRRFVPRFVPRFWFAAPGAECTTALTTLRAIGDIRNLPAQRLALCLEHPAQFAQPCRALSARFRQVPPLSPLRAARALPSSVVCRSLPRAPRLTVGAGQACIVRCRSIHGCQFVPASAMGWEARDGRGA